jgi:hypothetical protein
MTNLTFQSVAFESVTFESVAFEPCEAFRAPVEHDEPVCAGCGHLADDHETRASVTQLRRRRPVRQPAGVRKAS